MDTPPFRLSPLRVAVRGASDGDIPTAPPALDDRALAARPRLAGMDPHLHCSIIGTCLPTGELRRLMSRFMEVEGRTDLEVHHEAVRLVTHHPEAARAINKALDRRHDASVRRFSRASDAPGLEALWKQALKSGDVPGAYWAVMTHRRADPPLRQLVFGDVHMLSHLVGAANRADIRRLAELESDNAGLRERNESQQARIASLVGERDAYADEAGGLRDRIREMELERHDDDPSGAHDAAAAHALLSSSLVLEGQRRTAAEAEARTLKAQLAQARGELAHLAKHAEAIGRELAVAEAELRNAEPAHDSVSAELRGMLARRRVYYVGGRPSSNGAIRALVERHGGEYQRHDGGIEDRKGLLSAGIAWADVVVFPVDCIDHDSAALLKRACVQQGTPFVPLRSASVTSFAAGLIDRFAQMSRSIQARGCLGRA